MTWPFNIAFVNLEKRTKVRVYSVFAEKIMKAETGEKEKYNKYKTNDVQFRSIELLNMIFPSVQKNLSNLC
jgi:hypothetical protein